jgi:hypothetical protein
MSRRHSLAALGAAAARNHALLHVTDPLAIIGALGADFSALAASVLVVGRIQQHEVSRRPANLGACHHQREVVLFDVFAAHFQAMVHRGRETNGVAAKAFVDAGLHLGIKVGHRSIS